MLFIICGCMPRAHKVVADRGKVSHTSETPPLRANENGGSSENRMPPQSGRE
jgi:hypothetical protein